MPYTLAMGFLWVLLALLLGAIIGWLLRSIRASRQIARARSERNDTAEVEALRGRVANLEPLVGENDRLKAELEACRASKQNAGGSASGTANIAAAGAAGAAAATQAKSAPSSAPAKPAADAPAAPAKPSAERPAAPATPAANAPSGPAQAAAAAATAASAPAAPAKPAAPSSPAASSAPAAGAAQSSPAASSAPAAGSAAAAPAKPAAPASAGTLPGTSAPSADKPASPAAPAASGDAPKAPDTPSSVAAFSAPTSGGASTLDTNAASAVLGRKIKVDDLTVVEGIGPKISELCHGIGITTWRGLADTETSLLRTMLRDAGPRFQMHDPETWPKQAELLANGDWAAFAKLTAELDGGRPT